MYEERYAYIQNRIKKAALTISIFNILSTYKVRTKISNAGHRNNYKEWRGNIKSKQF